MVDASTKLVGLLGWPLQHSFSPGMHNAAFDALGLNWRYLPFPVSPDKLEDAFRGLLAAGIQGLNVTIPHKQTVISQLSSLEDSASQLGAVNTIKVDSSSGSEIITRGYNTDVVGFINALKEAHFGSHKGKSAVVIGAGGAARAVVSGLIQEGFSKITVLNRNVERGQALVETFCQYTCRMEALPLTTGHLIDCTSSDSLLVNSTPVGTWPESDYSVWPDQIPIPSGLTVFDLVYNPPMTKLLRQGRDSGAAIISGLEMLIYQGAQSFHIWTGLPAPVEVMRKACQTIIGGKNV